MSATQRISNNYGSAGFYIKDSGKIIENQKEKSEE